MGPVSQDSSFCQSEGNTPGLEDLPRSWRNAPYYKGSRQGDIVPPMLAKDYIRLEGFTGLEGCRAMYCFVEYTFQWTC